MAFAPLAMAEGEVGLHSECGLRRRRAVAPVRIGKDYTVISHLVKTSRFTEKEEGADYRLKTRLTSSMALCACIRIHPAEYGSVSGGCDDINIMTG